MIDETKLVVIFMAALAFFIFGILVKTAKLLDDSEKDKVKLSEQLDTTCRHLMRLDEEIGRLRALQGLQTAQSLYLQQERGRLSLRRSLSPSCLSLVSTSGSGKTLPGGCSGE